MRKDRNGGKRGDWDFGRFEEWMNRSFSFLKENADFTQLASLPVGKVVQEALEKAFGSAFAGVAGGAVSGRKPAWKGATRLELFETHRSLIVRLQLPAGIREDLVRTLVGSHRLRVEWPPDGRREVPLSRPVDPRKSRAAIQNGILEVRMPKIEERFYEL